MMHTWAREFGEGGGVTEIETLLPSSPASPHLSSGVRSWLYIQQNMYQSNILLPRENTIYTVNFNAMMASKVFLGLSRFGQV